jgi:NDMA-dependent alcohol dehydrogenase
MLTRAAVCWEVGRPWDVVDLVVPEPGPGEVLIKMEYAGLCHSDDHNITGDFPAELPVVGGHEGAGEVAAVGPGVTRASVGDAVLLVATPTCGVCRYCADGRGYLCDDNYDVMIGMRGDGTAPFVTPDGQGIGAYAQLGTFAEYTLVRQNRVIAYERDIPAQVAAITSCGVVTGYGSAVRVAEVRQGDTVVVVGVGGVGMSAVQGARIAGAAKIVAIDPVAFKRDQALKLGATHAVASIEAGQSLVAELTRNAMADSVILTPGVLTGEIVAAGAELAAKGGAIVLTAVAALTEVSIPIMISPFSLAAKRLLGCVFGQTRPYADVERIFDMYRSGALHLDEMITQEYPLDQINDGYKDMHAGINLRGVLRF